MNRSQIGQIAETIDDSVARLLLAAKDDRNLRKQVLYFARLSPEDRESIVNTVVHEMQLRGESRFDRAAFAMLATDEASRAAIEVLG